ncbi:hypothetical protein KJ815_12505 [bacterium]|nr:hypothetical protein [bacterium]
MKRLSFILHPSSFILFCTVAVFAQQPYDVGDWTSYRDFRNARALDVGAHEVFVATSGGLLEYKLMRKQWYDPIVIGYGLSEPIPLGDPVLLLFDEGTGYLWLATREELLLYDVNAERWRRMERHLWGPGERVVNIGVGGTDVYVETVPEKYYPTFFPPGSPIPTDEWWGFITRYKGSRTFGGFLLDIEPAEPADVRWRGLRSKVPIPASDLRGLIAVPPVGFPSLTLPFGWTWFPDGTLMDSYLRGMPITDWMIDRYGSLWTTFWGGGVMRADLHAITAEFFSAGPAGNDVRAIFVGQDEIWMGGFNSGDRQGISRASRDLISWQFHERRDDSRLRSTDVFDIAQFDGDPWIATDDGLLAFQKRKKRWSAFTVSDNLFSDQVRALAATDSELWVGTTRGLCVLKGSGREVWRIGNAGIELAGVNDIAFCLDTAYVATPHGIFKGSIHDREFRYWPMVGGFLDAPVPEISVMGPEMWWITSEGVLRYDQNTGEAKSWRAETWLGGEEPSCILATPKFVWVGTTASGFWRHNRTTGEWIQYTTADGLLDNRVQVIRRDGNDLLI